MKVKFPKSGRARGLTLSEAVLSLALLAMIILGSMSLLVLSRYSGSISKHRMQAIYMMQRTVENIRKTPFSSIVSATTTVSIDTKATPGTTSDDFTGTQIVTVTSPSAYYKKVVIELRWNETIFGTTKVLREYLGTFIANDPQAN